MICNNLAILLNNTNRYREAERYFREALKIRRRLAADNPGAYESALANTCNNLGNLLSGAKRYGEAEQYYGEALKIRRRLAADNPGAFEPDLAMTCHNYGLLEWERGNLDAARKLLQEALSLYEKFPHLTKRAQHVQHALNSLKKRHSLLNFFRRKTGNFP